MDEVLAKAEEWRAEGEEVALATVVATRRSAPRPLGSKLAVTASGRLFGSVSGGCVEADVAERAKSVLAGSPPEVVSYGIADDQAWSVGLPCAGELLVAWPEDVDVDADTALVSLVHEERLDIPALKRAVEGGAFYVGALGSRRAQEKRREHLGDLLDRVRGPVGLDLG